MYKKEFYEVHTSVDGKRWLNAGGRFTTPVQAKDYVAKETSKKPSRYQDLGCGLVLESEAFLTTYRYRVVRVTKEEVV